MHIPKSQDISATQQKPDDAKLGRYIAFPGRSNRNQNPYNAILCDALDKLGWSVEEPGALDALKRRAVVVHFHWPQAAVNQPMPTMLRRTAHILAICVVQKLRGAKILWTVHNPKSHERRRPGAEQVFMRLFTRCLDGLILLNASTRELLIADLPSTRRLPHRIIPHHSYGNAYPAPAIQPDARERFGIGQDRPVLGIIGDLKAYKGIEELIRLFCSAPQGAAGLFIAGRFTDPVFADHIRALIATAREAGSSITLREGRLDDQSLVDALSACDMLALPYKGDANSGMAILATELGIPLLTSRSAALVELQRDIAHPAAAIMDDDFSPEALHRAIMDARRIGKRSPPATFSNPREGIEAARQITQFIASLQENPHH